MATSADHLARAAANDALGQRLRSEGEYNWAVVVLYYSALHHAAALLADLGVNTEALTHIEIEAKLDKHFPGIASRYLSLQGMSRRARYFPTHAADDETCRRAKQHVDHIADFGRRVRNGSVSAIR